MKLEIAISKRILDLCKEKNITVNKLANLSGIPSATIRCIFYGRSKNTGLRTILDICQGLDITLYQFFDDPVFKTKDIEGTY